MISLKNDLLILLDVKQHGQDVFTIDITSKLHSYYMKYNILQLLISTFKY